jgi:hypothetical protein
VTRQAATRIEAGVGDLVWRIRDDQAHVGYLMARRSGGQWFGLKTTMTVSWFGPQNQGRWFGDLGLKITVTVSWFGPQNQVGGGLLICTSKPMSRWRRCEKTRRHSTSCFVMKQVGLRFPSFASKLAKE